MFARLARVFSSKVFSPQKVPKLMASQRVRYLPNELTDYKDGNTIVVPEDEFKTQIFKYIEEIRSNIEPNERNGKDGLYLGSAGIAYMFYHLSKIPALSNYKSRFLTQALEYLAPALKVCTYETNAMDIPALMLGNCGVYAVASAIFYTMGDLTQSSHYRDLYLEAAAICKNINFLPAGSDEFFVGRTGYIVGALWMSKETSSAFKTQEIYDLCRLIVISGRQYANANKSPAPLMYSYYDVEYLGAGHGISAILQILMTVPGYLDANPRDAKDVKSTVDYVLSLQDAEGNFPAATDEIKSNNNELVHWCHGAGGVVYLMAKAYLIWNEDKYLNSCKRASELIWSKGLLRKGPGICHGIAGNAYVFILMYRLTNDQKYLYRAVQFGKYLEDKTFKEQARIPDNPFSLYEGVAGTACFLADLLSPSNASFPFLDVF